MQVVGLLVFVFTLVSGLIGTQIAGNNFSVTMFWIVFYLGFTYTVALFGNFWSWVNPLRTLLIWARQLTGRQLTGIAEYPKRWGYWPALISFFGLIWLEVLSSGFGVVPLNLARILISYSVITIIGAIWYGTTDWFRYGDFFTVLFCMVGNAAPVEWGVSGPKLRAPFVGLLDEKPRHLTYLLFVLFMLASTAYDGLRDTLPFNAFYNRLVGVLPNLGQLPPNTVKSILLLLGPLVFLLIYWLFMWLMRWVVSSKLTVRELMLGFAPTLVPIAVAYNAAHYYTLFLIQGQVMIRLISDPLGRGWNLFGTAAYKVNVGLLGAATIWYSQVALIVIGHIAAVYLAHVVALRIFPTAKKAIVSQYPMLVLMVVYTMISLWIIAQPLANG